jgi:hypothetical protein
MNEIDMLCLYVETEETGTCTRRIYSCCTINECKWIFNDLFDKNHEDTNVVMRDRKRKKDSQCNGQKTNNDFGYSVLSCFVFMLKQKKQVLALVLIEDLGFLSLVREIQRLSTRSANVAIRSLRKLTVFRYVTGSYVRSSVIEKSLVIRTCFS